jgi:hypothetical protein
MYSQLRDNTQITKTFEEIIFDLTNIPTDKESVVEQLKSIIKKIEINNLKAKQKDLSIKVALAEEAGKSKKAEEYLKELTKINNLLKEKEGA